MNARYCSRCNAVNEASASNCCACGHSLERVTNPLPPASGNNHTSHHPVRTEIIHIGLPQISNRTGLASIVGKILSRSDAPVTESSADPPATAAPGTAAEISPETSNESATQSMRALAREQNKISLPSLALIIGLAAMFTLGAWFFYKDQAQTASRNKRTDLRLIAPDEKSQKIASAGMSFLDDGSYEEAITSFREAIELNQNNIQALMGLGRAYYATGRIEDSLKAYSQLLDIDPDNLEGRYQRGQIYQARGAWAEAWRDYRHIVSVDPNSEQATRALEIMTRSTVVRQESATEDRNTRRGKSRQPAGRVLPESGNHASVSLPLASVVTSLSPPLPVNGNLSPSAAEDEFMHNAYLRRGLDLSGKGRYNEAVEELRKAQRINPGNPDVYYHLASAQMQLRQYDQARDNYSRCYSGTYASVARNGARDAEKKANQAVKQAEKAAKKNQRSEE